MAKLKELLLKNWMAPFVGILADALLCFYLYLKISNYQYFRDIFLRVLDIQGVDPVYIGEELIQSYFHLMANTTLTIILLFLLLHLGGYFLLFKKKVFTHNYFHLYFATAFLGFIALVLTGLFSPSVIILWGLIEAVLYGMGFFSLRFLSKEEAEGNGTPAP